MIQRIAFLPDPNVGADAVARMRLQAEESVHHGVNAERMRLSDGSRFRIDLEFVGPKDPRPHAEVRLQTVMPRSNSRSWHLRATRPTFVHEIMHNVGLGDRYVDPDPDPALGRESGAGLAVDWTGSLMGDATAAPARFQPAELAQVETILRTARTTIGVRPPAAVEPGPGEERIAEESAHLGEITAAAAALLARDGELTVGELSIQRALLNEAAGRLAGLLERRGPDAGDGVAEAGRALERAGDALRDGLAAEARLRLTAAAGLLDDWHRQVAEDLPPLAEGIAAAQANLDRTADTGTRAERVRAIDHLQEQVEQAIWSGAMVESLGVAIRQRRRIVEAELGPLEAIDPELARRMEPRAARPERRLEAMAAVARAGVPVGVMIGPVIPGLNDAEIPRILEAAARAGAQSASWVLLRLPKPVDELFERWLEERYPERRARVLARIRDTRGGRLSDSSFGHRHRGQGEYAEQIAALFAAAAKKHGLDRPFPPLETAAFRRPPTPGAQLSLL